MHPPEVHIREVTGVTIPTYVDKQPYGCCHSEIILSLLLMHYTADLLLNRFANVTDVQILIVFRKVHILHFKANISCVQLGA